MRRNDDDGWHGDGDGGVMVMVIRGQKHTPVVVMHSSMTKHRVVLDLRLLQDRAVVGDDHELSLPLAESLEGAAVSQSVLSCG